MKQKLIIAIDSGSGAIKFGFAKLNIDTGKVEDVDYSPDKSVKIKLSEDLETEALIREIEESGYIQDVYDKENNPLNICEVFNPELRESFYAAPTSSLNARKHLESRYNNKFSTDIRERYLSYITSVVKEIGIMYPNQEIEVDLVGTAALRKADNANHLIRALDNALVELGITTNIKIISQKDEGIYAFEGAAARAKLEKDKIITWDIGGGSMQITGTNANDYQVLGGITASSTFKSKVIELLGRVEQNSIYPMSKEDIKKSIQLGIEQVTFPTAQEEWLKRKKEQKPIIVGAGNIHDSILRLMKHNNIVSFDRNSYTKKDLDKIIDLFTNKNAEQVNSYLSERDQAFSENILTNMILVRSTMKKYDIKKVKVVEVSNTDTIIAKAVQSHIPNHSSQNVELLPDLYSDSSSILTHKSLPQSYRTDNHQVSQPYPTFEVNSLLNYANIAVKFLQHLWPRKFGASQSAPIDVKLDPKIKAASNINEEHHKLEQFQKRYDLLLENKELKKDIDYIREAGKSFSGQNSSSYIEFSSNPTPKHEEERNKKGKTI